MKRQTDLIVGLIICLSLAGYYGYLIFTGIQAPATANQTGAPAALKLDEKSLLDIRSKSINPNLPLTVTPNDLGNSQLFQ